MMGANSGGNGKMMNFGKSRAKMAVDTKNINFKKVAGLKEEKEELEEVVDFLKNPRKYIDMGARIPKGILLEDLREQVKHCLQKQLPVKQAYHSLQFQVLTL